MPAPLSASVRCVDPLLSAHYARPHPRPASRIPLLITTACDRWTGRPCKPFGFILPNSIHCTEALEAAEGEKERSKTGWALTQTDNLRWRAALVIVPFFSAASPKNSVPLLMVVPSTPGRTDRQSFFLVLVPIAPFQKASTISVFIPRLASDDARIALSQATVAPSAPTAATKKAAQSTSMTLRSHRLAQVRQAKG
ncbi:hypothetical protein DEU56DRAFT_584974 [Suillus clintonianus]|uniref:uncharacterized protein n=1 Tax=Suillus clintonianus TaxID=1904413 RepID=UPI001B8665C5|nr:uncharacterized protein DEU56DRAFT_584974 [Suillus clintonianus]KAG2125103.1 hypothetical protein DEU56DRAFT_584974 [Suillus clintonianus]